MERKDKQPFELQVTATNAKFFSIYQIVTSGTVIFTPETLGTINR